MNKLFQILAIICLTFCSINIIAQQSESQSFPLKISVLDESLTLPGLGSLNYEYNPAIMIGTEYLLKTKRQARLASRS